MTPYWPTLRDELADEFQTAVKALESRLVALEAASMGKVAQEKKADKIAPVAAVEALPDEPPSPANKYAERNAAIIELREAGLTFQKISDTLAERGIVSGSGNPLNPGTISLVLKKRRK